MKKPVMILTSLVLISASSVAYFAPPQAGAAKKETSEKKVQKLSKAGLMPPAQAEALQRMLMSAMGKAKEANSTMSGQAKENAPGPQGAQTAPGNAPNGQAASGPPSPPPPPPMPKWRLEGTMVGGDRAPSAMFVVDGWGEILVHPGEKLNARIKVLGIRGRQVTLLTDGKNLERISPW